MTIEEYRKKHGRQRMAKIRVIMEVSGIFPMYQPPIGSIHAAKYIPSARRPGGDGNGEFCIVRILDKNIVLRRDEFELLEA